MQGRTQGHSELVWQNTVRSFVIMLAKLKIIYTYIPRNVRNEKLLCTFALTLLLFLRFSFIFSPKTKSLIMVFTLVTCFTTITFI